MTNTVSPMKKFLRNCGKRWQLFLFLLPMSLLFLSNPLRMHPLLLLLNYD